MRPFEVEAKAADPKSALKKAQQKEKNKEQDVMDQKMAAFMEKKA